MKSYMTNLFYITAVILLIFSVSIQTRLISSITEPIREAFTEMYGLSPAIEKTDETKGLPQVVSGPANANIVNQRTPYHLLEGSLADAPVDDVLSSRLNSCACFGKDFSNRIQLTKTYNQITNNYKHAGPDSCSAPFHELVNNFYKPMTISKPDV